jgi:hypothetical protein
MKTGVATGWQAYDGRPVGPRCRLLRYLLGGVGLGLQLHSFPWGGCLIDTRLPLSLAFCIIYYNCTTMRAWGVATLRLGLKVVVGPRQKRNVPGPQRIAYHAHRVLAKSVQVGLLAQLWRRTGTGSWLRQYFLHYFSVQIPRGEWGVRTSEKAASTHSRE